MSLDAANLRLASESAVELARQTWKALNLGKPGLAYLVTMPSPLVPQSRTDVLDSLVDAGLAYVNEGFYQPTPWGEMVFLEGDVEHEHAGGVGTGDFASKVDPLWGDESDAERRLRYAREDFEAARNIYAAAVNTDSGVYPGDLRRFAKDALDCAMQVSEALKLVRAEQEARRSQGGAS